MAFGFLKKAVKSIGKAAASVARNPMVKIVASGAALVFPPVGVPAVVAVNTADKVLAGLNSKVPAQVKAATNIVQRTAALAKNGDKDASRALALVAKRKRNLAAGKGTRPAAVQAAAQRSAWLSLAARRRNILAALTVTPQGRLAYRDNKRLFRAG